MKNYDRRLWGGVCLCVSLFLSSCAAVKPYEREHLGDPIMTFDGQATEDARELKWLEAREGSTGGVGGAGGGCACS